MFVKSAVITYKKVIRQKIFTMAVNLHIKFISFGNFIGGVLQILCGMKLVSYKMPSQILR